MDKKYCSQCAYCVPSTLHIAEPDKFRFAKCSHPSASQDSKGDEFVSALLDVGPQQYYCSSMRLGTCGADASLFQVHAEAA